MKTAKRFLAVVIAVIMIVGTCAVAVSAADVNASDYPTLQAAINAAAAGDTVKLNKETTETITIGKNLTIDLNGYRLLSNEGEAAIKITAGNVTVTNGQVISRYKNVPSAEMLQNVWKDSPPAIRITGGSVTVDGVRVVGGMVRVPTTTSDFVPSGSGFQSYNGATVTIKRSSIYGDYGVNNAVRSNTAGGLVTIEDAIILSYTKAIKGGKNTYKVADGSEEIIAADRIAGVLNSGIHLEPDEQELVNNFFDERVIIVTKKADTLINELELDTPTITVVEGKSTAKVDAQTIDYTWPNTKGTDCSYKLVPEAVKLSDGSSAALDAVDAAKVVVTGENALTAQQLRYRVEFKISDEAKPYIDMLLSEGLDNPLDGCLGWAGETLDEYYAQFTAKNNNGYVDTYDELVAELGDLLYMVDEVGSAELFGVRADELEEYSILRRALYEMAGKVAYDNSGKRYDYQMREFGQFYPFGNDAYQAVFGTSMPAGWKSTLDRVDDLKKTLETKRGTSFTKTENWGDIAIWLVETVYPELIGENENSPSIINTLIAQLKNLDELLKGEKYQALINEMGAQSQVALLAEGIQNAETIVGYVRKAQNSGGDIQATIDYVLANKAKIKGYVDKAVDVIENWRTYVTPENFIDGDFVTTYSTLGALKPEKKDAPGNLSIQIIGAGNVAFSGGTVDADGDAYNGVAEEDMDVAFISSFTLTAQFDEGDEDTEFMFWANVEDGVYQIVSTEPSYTMVTTIKNRAILAVFASKDEPTAYFTNASGGQLCGLGDVAMIEEEDYIIYAPADVDDPALAAYTFTGWPADSEHTAATEEEPATHKISIAAKDNTAYFGGSSAFAVPGAYYGPDGAILKIRPVDCSGYIVTPTYSISGEITITLNDNGETYTATGKTYDVVTKTSDISGAAYWRDASSKKTVSVTKDLYYMILGNAVTLESVAGACPDTFVTNTTFDTTDQYLVIYVARSSSKAIRNTGIVYSSKNALPTLNTQYCYKATDSDNAQNGIYTGMLPLSWVNGKTVTVRPYIEFTDGTVEYGAVAQY